MKLRSPTVLAAAVVGIASILAGCQRHSSDGTPVLATVNNDTITQAQLDYARKQLMAAHPGASAPDNAQILKGLVEQRLITQKAEKEKLDRNPGVLQALEAARKDALAHFYVEEQAAKVPKPTAADIQQYFDAHPLNFAQRDIYTLQRVDAQLPADQIGPVGQAVQATTSAADALALLKSKATATKEAVTPQPAETLGPLLPRIAALKPGQTLVVPQHGGLSAVTLMSIDPRPVTLAQAGPSIETFLWNQRKRQALQAEAKSLCDGARIEYLGKFADGSSPASACELPEPANASAAPEPASAASQ
ncbi:MAG TPA: EpsD family peptidyl-prolyl cis-trans isomerase [Burkholderiaceae bacterium]